MQGLIFLIVGAIAMLFSVYIVGLLCLFGVSAVVSQMPDGLWLAVLLTLTVVAWRGLRLSTVGKS
jgi:hypothetical protein